MGDDFCICKLLPLRCDGWWKKKRGWESRGDLELGRIFTDVLLSLSLFVLMLSPLEELVLLPQYGLNAEPRIFNGSEIDLVLCLTLWLS
jgi:hypothetical protein